MVPKRITPPTEPVVVTADMKDHLSVDFDTDNELITGYVQAATDHLDGYAGILGRCLVAQDWQMKLEDWPIHALRLPFPDVSVAEITYLDADGAEQSVPDDEFELIETALGTEIRFKDRFSAPSVSDDTDQAITVTFTAGYGDVSDVPAPIKAAIMLLVAHWYEHREASGKADVVPFGVTVLTAPYRRVAV